MNRLAILLATLLCVGCQFTAVPDSVDRKGPTPIEVQEHAPASEIWLSLAHNVENLVITSPKDLARYVKALADSGDLMQSDEAKFDAAFSNARSDERELDKNADSAKLRGLK